MVTGNATCILYLYRYCYAFRSCWLTWLGCNYRWGSTKYMRTSRGVLFIPKGQIPFCFGIVRLHRQRGDQESENGWQRSGVIPTLGISQFLSRMFPLKGDCLREAENKGFGLPSLGWVNLMALETNHWQFQAPLIKDRFLLFFLVS